MSIILTFLEPSVTEELITSVFEDTFGNVIGRVALSTIKKNQYGNQYRTARIEFSNQPTELQRWVKVIRDSGMNSLCYTKGKYWPARMLEEAVPKTVSRPLIEL
jgi:hypothetical protein